MSEQFELFISKNLNPITQVKKAMRIAIKGSELSREQVVEQMNELAINEGLPHREGNSKGITIDMMEKWLAPSAIHVMPWKFFPIFCQTTKNNNAIAALAECIGAQLIFGDEIALLKWASVERQVKKLRRNQKLLEQRLET